MNTSIDYGNKLIKAETCFEIVRTPFLPSSEWDNFLIWYTQDDKK